MIEPSAFPIINDAQALTIVISAVVCLLMMIHAWEGSDL